MQVVNILDVSLGQGPLQVSTQSTVFGCTAPVDNTTWQSLTSPLLSVSQIIQGATGQNSTLMVNGDLWYRSYDGVRSLVLGRREVVNPGNTPLSNEVSRYLMNDDPQLLRYGSAAYFDNRILFTVSPVYSEHGVFHRGVVAVNTDVLSTIRGKQPACWEGLYTGPNTLQLVTGLFGGAERAFVFSLNTFSSEIEVFELLPSATSTITDFNGQEIPISCAMETGDMFRESGIKEFTRVRLVDGELYIEDIQGLVNFRVLWRPDMLPCFVEWKRFSVCAPTRSCSTDDFGCLQIKTERPQYRTRVGLGEPPLDCDPISNRPFREFYTCGLRIEWTGHARVSGGKLVAVPTDEPAYAVAECV